MQQDKPVRAQARLYYIHDPMCSWCWAFQPVWRALRAQLPASLAVHDLLGWLAADSDLPMPLSMQQAIQAHWRRIERVVPGTVFNFAFWQQCIARRSTYPACRAVIVARKQQAAEAMIRAIGEAYYQQARNPSDDDVLVACAAGLGLDATQFRRDLNAVETELQLQQEMAMARRLGVTGFPSLVLETAAGLFPLDIDYCDMTGMLSAIFRVLHGDSCAQ